MSPVFPSSPTESDVLSSTANPESHSASIFPDPERALYSSGTWARSYPIASAMQLMDSAQKSLKLTGNVERVSTSNRGLRSGVCVLPGKEQGCR